MPPETGWFRTESGTVLEMDLPLPDGIAQRAARGEIVRVADSAGSPWVEPGQEAPPAPPQSQELAEVRQQLAVALERVEELEAEKVDLLAEMSRLQPPPDPEPESDQTPDPEPAKAADPPPTKSTKAPAKR